MLWIRSIISTSSIPYKRRFAHSVIINSHTSSCTFSTVVRYLPHRLEELLVIYCHGIVGRRTERHHGLCRLGLRAKARANGKLIAKDVKKGLD
jgi:hypothetical protein